MVSISKNLSKYILLSIPIIYFIFIYPSNAQFQETISTWISHFEWEQTTLPIPPYDSWEPFGSKYKTFYSPTVNKTVSYLVYLPPSYNTSTNRYPVVYWLPGGQGDQFQVGAFLQNLSAAINAGQAPEMIVVGVNAVASSSFYVNSYAGDLPLETIIIKDLIPHVDSTYRTIAQREFRAVEGFSMGGYGASHLGFKYPEVFGVISDHAGALFPATEGKTALCCSNVYRAWNYAFGANEAYFNASSPLTLAQQNADSIRGRTHIRIMFGDQDKTSGIPGDIELHELLQSLNITHEFKIVAGIGHDKTPYYNLLGFSTFNPFYINAFSGTVPPPPPTPTPSCSLSANPSSGTGPFSSTIMATYSNLNTAPNAITINCGTGLSSSTATNCTGTTGSCTATCSYPSVTSPTSYTVSASASGTACSSATINVNPPPTPLLSLSSSLPSIVADGISTSTLTASTPDSRPNITISFTTSLGTLSSQSCTTASDGKCSITIKSSTTGSATINASSSRYTSSSTTVAFTAADTAAPILSNPSPTGNLPSTTQTTISLTTDESATCKYDTIANTDYNSMSNTFTDTGATSHFSSVAVSDGSFTYYIKCKDSAGNINTDDFLINFNVEAAPIIIYPPPSGGGGGGGYSIFIPSPPVSIVSIDETPLEQNITETVPIITTPVTGDIDIGIQSIDTIENGEPFTVTLILKSNTDMEDVDVFLQSKFNAVDEEFTSAFKQWTINLTANEEKQLTFDLTSPSRIKGGFSVEAKAIQPTGDENKEAKTITIDFKPLLLDVIEKQIGDKKQIKVTTKSFEDMQTEIEIIRNGEETVFIEIIEGKKEYNAQLELLKPGHYQIKATAKSAQGTIDEDIRYVTVEGEEQPDYGLTILVIIIVIVILSIFLIRQFL